MKNATHIQSAWMKPFVVLVFLICAFSCREKQPIEPDSELSVESAKAWYSSQRGGIKNNSLINHSRSKAARTRIVIDPEWQMAEMKTGVDGQPFLLVPVNSDSAYQLGDIGFRNLMLRKNAKGGYEAFTVEMIGEKGYMARKNHRIDPADFTGEVIIYYTDRQGIYASGRSQNGRLVLGYTDSTAARQARSGGAAGGRTSGNVVKSCQTVRYCGGGIPSTR